MMYADVRSLTLSFAECETELQMAINKMCIYCNSLDLTINPTKTKVVIFGKGVTRNDRILCTRESR